MAALPIVPGSQPPAPATPDMAALMGMTGGAAPGGVQQQPMGQQDAAKAVMYQVHDLQAGVEALARQFPQVGEEARQIKDLLMSLMTKAVGSMSGPEAPAPPVVG